MTVRQETDYPTTDRTRLTFTGGDARFTLRLRVPAWVADSGREPRLEVNGRPFPGRLKPGTYAAVERHWRPGDTVELVLPRRPVWRAAPDNTQVKSVSYGPLVLAGEYGDTALATLPAIRPQTLRPVSGSGTAFTAVADGRHVSLRPFHEVHHQRYNVYWAVRPRPARERDIARYPFDEGTGTSAADRTRTFADATLASGATWTEADGVRSVSLDGKGAHVVLPAGLPGGLDELTVSVRVRVDTLVASARVFDLGYHKDTYLFLAATTGARRARAALKIAGMESEDVIDAGGPLPVGQWVHVALTLGGGTGVLYLDGVEAGRNDAMVASPLLLGASTRNHLGRSQNSTHPYLHGAVRDFRLHNRALSASEAARLAAG